MAFRLGPLVVRGEIFNTRVNSVHGWIELRGQERPLLIELTGDCEPDLAGKRFRFEARPPRAHEKANETDLHGLAWHQVGPTGTMTASRMIKDFDCSIEELLSRSKLGEPPPMEWKRSLYLEWFSQNGRVVIELTDPTIMLVDDEDNESPYDATVPLPGDLEQMEPPGELGLSATVLRRDEEGKLQVDRIQPDDSEDGVELPSPLEHQFDAEAREIDHLLGIEDEGEDALRDAELMDEVIGRDGVSVGAIFKNIEKLPAVDDLSDERVHRLLKYLLAELALCGVALHVCEHFTSRDTYRFIVEELATNESFHPELQGTQWVQNFLTAEFCPQCEVEAQRKFEEYEREREGEE